MLNGKIPLLHHRIPEVGRDLRNCSEETGKPLNTLTG